MGYYQSRGESSMTYGALLICLRAQGVAIYLNGNNLKVSAPEGLLSNETWQDITNHKDLLLNLPYPYINSGGELIIPTDAPPQYHWQDKEKTLRELKASPDVWKRNMFKPCPADLVRGAVG